MTVEALTNEEALANIASVFSTGVMKVNNLEVTDILKANSGEISKDLKVGKLQLGDEGDLKKIIDNQQAQIANLQNTTNNLQNQINQCVKKVPNS